MQLRLTPDGAGAAINDVIAYVTMKDINDCTKLIYRLPHLITNSRNRLIWKQSLKPKTKPTNCGSKQILQFSALVQFPKDSDDEDLIARKVECCLELNKRMKGRGLSVEKINELARNRDNRIEIENIIIAQNAEKREEKKVERTEVEEEESIPPKDHEKENLHAELEKVPACLGSIPLLVGKRTMFGSRRISTQKRKRV